jgi:hypothetical protein
MILAVWNGFIKDQNDSCLYNFSGNFCWKSLFLMNKAVDWTRQKICLHKEVK